MLRRARMHEELSVTPPSQWRKLSACAMLIAATACADSSRGDGAHPADLTGRWLRLRQDGSWGDTMQFNPDGTLGGSTGYPVPLTLRWEVKRDAHGAAQYCAMQGNDGFCRDFRLRGDTLEMFGGPQGNTTFRRVR